MARRGVDEARARVVGDMVPVKHGHLEVVATEIEVREGMGGGEAGEYLSRHGVKTLESSDAGGLEDFLGQLVGEDQLVAHLGPVVRSRLRHLIEP